MTKNILLHIVIVLFLVTGIQLRINAQDHHGEDHANTAVSETVHDSDQPDGETVENHGAVEGEHSEGGEGEHEGGMEPLLFVIIAIFIGAATRHFFRKIPLPFTVLLLIFGIGLGLMNRFDLFHGWGESFSKALIWAGHINPHAILFIFLPILIFEAAFGMDIHTFKKTATNSIILAVPGIIVALLLSAGLAMLMKFMNIGLYSWEWSIALMFGSVISATDPVAVVALLKELGASKKLGTL
ncbi:MAG: cation:proton antiporter, partial [Bacteroidota bacterium]